MGKYQMPVKHISQTITKYGKQNFNLDYCFGCKFCLGKSNALVYIPFLSDQDICHFNTSIFNLLENLHLMGGPSTQEVKTYLRYFEIKEAKM